MIIENYADHGNLNRKAEDQILAEDIWNLTLFLVGILRVLMALYSLKTCIFHLHFSYGLGSYYGFVSAYMWNRTLSMKKTEYKIPNKNA